ncbi:hypothetical protein CJ030_MR5G027230 [Morella rubra]|uniref:Uncharacterized protein n=1 Tax=Morella rubra TaxID=262757 RepID=A0A6A1VNB9_9ROSI|nr:hypothetical protein CJ030_MR5G027230 [Morella rubra]
MPSLSPQLHFVLFPLIAQGHMILRRQIACTANYPTSIPYEKAGIPEGCDNLDKLPSLALATNFFTSTSMLSSSCGGRGK